MRERNRFVVALALSWVVLTGCGSTPPSSERSGALEDPSAPADSVAAEPAVPSDAVAPEPAPPPSPAPAPVPAPVEKPAPPAEPGFLLKGTVAYRDGRPAAAFKFLLVDEARDIPLLLFGVEGAFEGRVPGPGTYRLRNLLVEGELHDYLPEEWKVEEGKPLDLVLEEKAEGFLLAVDAGTGRPLPGARALRINDMARDSHPGRYPVDHGFGRREEFPDDGKGLIRIGRGRGRERIWVVAEGHAWTVGEVDHGAAGPSTVRLPAGGTARIRITGWDPALEARVHAQFGHRGGSAVMPEPDAAGNLLLEGLPVGTMFFQVRRGGPGIEEEEGPGKVAAEIRPGATTEVALEVRLAQRAAPVPVSGTVVLPPGWGGGEMRVFFEGADEDNGDVGAMVDLLFRGEGKPRTFRVPDGLPPGRYRIQLAGRTSVITVPPEGADLGIVIENPAEVRVRVLSAETGEPLPGARVMWHVVEEGSNSWVEEEATFDRSTGEFVIRFPGGRLSINASAPGAVPAEDRGFDPSDDIEDDTYRAYAPGEKAEREIRLAAGGRVKIHLQGEGATQGRDLMVWVWQQMAESTKAGGTRTTGHGRSWNGEEVLFDGVPVGDYYVEVKEDDEVLEDVEARDVEVRAGETAKVTLEIPPRKAEAVLPEVEGLLRVVDDETGEPIPDAEVCQVVELKGRRRGWSFKQVPGTGRPGEFLFRGPPGIVLFSAKAPGHIPEGDDSGRNMELVAGRTVEHVCRLKRGGGIRVVIRGGDPSSEPPHVTLRRDGDFPRGGVVSHGFPARGGRVEKDGFAPGAYILEVEAPGSAPVPARKVEIRKGETTEVVVDLVRRE